MLHRGGEETSPSSPLRSVIRCVSIRLVTAPPRIAERAVTCIYPRLISLDVSALDVAGGAHALTTRHLRGPEFIIDYVLHLCLVVGLAGLMVLFWPEGMFRTPIFLIPLGDWRM